jgi:hypothetical protein
MSDCGLLIMKVLGGSNLVVWRSNHGVRTSTSVYISKYDTLVGRKIASLQSLVMTSYIITEIVRCGTRNTRKDIEPFDPSQDSAVDPCSRQSDSQCFLPSLSRLALPL